jgi:hypothetical protein
VLQVVLGMRPRVPRVLYMEMTDVRIVPILRIVMIKSLFRKADAVYGSNAPRSGILDSPALVFALAPVIYS